MQDCETKAQLSGISRPTPCSQQSAAQRQDKLCAVDAASDRSQGRECGFHTAVGRERPAARQLHAHSPASSPGNAERWTKKAGLSQASSLVFPSFISLSHASLEKGQSRGQVHCPGSLQPRHLERASHVRWCGNTTRRCRVMSKVCTVNTKYHVIMNISAEIKHHTFVFLKCNKCALCSPPVARRGKQPDRRLH